MKGDGIDSSLQFILKENSPILELKGSRVEETGKKLVRGTVVNGMLKTRIINVDGQKVPFRFIQLSNKKGYISPQVVDVYIGTFANLDGLAPQKDKTPTKPTAFGEKSNGKRGKAKNFVINYALPVAGGVVGYKIAQRMGADTKKTAGLVLFFGLLGCIPRYIYRNK